tara:strand:+ start:1399 stop:1590 length:192 start_codon:yes stop_codon:yes gene_type:complete
MILQKKYNKSYRQMEDFNEHVSITDEVPSRQEMFSIIEGLKSMGQVIGALNNFSYADPMEIED